MPSTRGLWRRSLLLASLRSHRGALLGWVLGGGAFLVFFGLSYRTSVETFAGGREAFGVAAAAVADAMRPLSGQAFRLDTYAGYVAYHNVGFMVLFIAVYAAIQGARLVRGPEESGALDIWLATGTSRRRVYRDRFLAFLLALAAIGVGAGAGLGGGAAVAGEPDWANSMLVALAAVLVAAVFYALAGLVSGFTATARTAAGATAAAVGVLYVYTNVWDRLGWLGSLRYASPFFYFQQSKYAMVPGHHADPLAMLVLALAVPVLGVLGAAAFARRDLGAAIWGRERRRRRWRVRGHRPGTLSLWTSTLRNQRVGLAAWFVAVFVLGVLYVGVWQPIRDIWENSAMIRALLARTSQAPIFDQYLSLILSTVAIAACAFAVEQAGRWIGESTSGREDLYLGMAPVSRRRVVLERALALTIGLTVLAIGVMLGVWVGAVGAGENLNLQGALRTGADLVLLGLAVGGAGAAIAAYLRSGAALGVLAALLAASYLVNLVQPLFQWPEWTLRFSVFDAFGEPYVAEPEMAGLWILVGVAVLGIAAAALRRPSGRPRGAPRRGGRRPAPAPPPPGPSPRDRSPGSALAD